MGRHDSWQSSSLPGRMNSSARQTARFRYGWAWGSPELRSDGLRGVGVTDLERRRTRAVGVAIPPQLLSQMRAVPARNPFRWALARLLARRLTGLRPSEYRFEDGEGWFRTPPREEWQPLGAEVADPAAPIEALEVGSVAVPAKRSGYTGEEMWHVVEVTELGCDYDAPDLWAEWARVTPQPVTACSTG